MIKIERDPSKDSSCFVMPAATNRHGMANVMALDPFGTPIFAFTAWSTTDLGRRRIAYQSHGDFLDKNEFKEFQRQFISIEEEIALQALLQNPIDGPSKPLKSRRL